mmetsp:Transcript_28267/g.39788  ORF Transcript_28267/g.39788 Transcript_28267/m.39788 type:complete len:95 (-) Transcript_28267:1302-1586(-)
MNPTKLQTRVLCTKTAMPVLTRRPCATGAVTKSVMPKGVFMDALMDKAAKNQTRKSTKNAVVTKRALSALYRLPCVTGALRIKHVTRSEVFTVV